MSNILHEERFAVHPRDVKHYDTEQLRRDFLVDSVFTEDKIKLVYSYYDRFIVGGAMPVNAELSLDTIGPLKADYFFERREAGIINIGGKGSVIIDGTSHSLSIDEAIYIGKGVTSVILKSDDPSSPALFYINSATAHHAFPTKKIGLPGAIKLDLGKPEEANVRQIIQFIVRGTVETCQLQMGITRLKPGSVWNSIPPHTHQRRMEAYFYTDIPDGQAICHFMGEASETRHIWLRNNQVVLAPSWSIHSGVGTSNYSFVWGMAGENLDFTDMDVIPVSKLK